MIQITNNRYHLLANTNNVGFQKNIAPAVGAAAIAGGASLLGSLLGIGNTSKTNATNLAINKMNNEFNSKEAAKQRDWQKQMMDLYGTSSAKANNMRAAGLNSLLGDVSASSVGSGSSASASSPGFAQTADYSGISNLGANTVNAYNQAKATQSQTEVNETIKQVNQANADLMKANEQLSKDNSRLTQQRVEEMKLNVDFLTKTLSSRVRTQYMNETISNWQHMDIKYGALTKMYDLYHIQPEVVNNYQATCALTYAQAFKAVAEGQLTLKEVDNYAKNLAIRQTMASASMLGAQAQMKSSSAYANYTEEQQYGLYLDNDQKLAFNNFWLYGRTPNFNKLLKKDSPMYNLYKLNFATALQTKNNLMLQPSLMKSMVVSNYSGAASGLINSGANQTKCIY